jgi:hypothetical protein
VQFFMARVEFAATARDWSFRACNHGPYSHVPLRFREAPEFPSLLREAALWTRSRDDYYFQHYAAQLFDTMFQPLDATLVSFLQEWLDVAGPEDISVISQIIRHSAPNCVIDHAPFSIRLLETAKTFGMETFDAVLSELYAGAVSGMRSGTFGEPFPQDISLKAEAESLLRDIPRLSPAYQLYESIRDHADGNIKQSLREAEALEELSGAISP